MCCRGDSDCQCKQLRFTCRCVHKGPGPGVIERPLQVLQLPVRRKSLSRNLRQVLSAEGTTSTLNSQCPAVIIETQRNLTLTKGTRKLRPSLSGLGITTFSESQAKAFKVPDRVQVIQVDRRGLNVTSHVMMPVPPTRCPFLTRSPGANLNVRSQSRDLQGFAVDPGRDCRISGRRPSHFRLEVPAGLAWLFHC
jgi:hypothetical protein